MLRGKVPAKPLVIFGKKIPKVFVYASAAVATFGTACIIKDYVGGTGLHTSVQADDKVVVITGANTGIGKATAFELAKRGARVYMACRDLNRCEQARREIVTDTRNKYVYCRRCDLASLQSIREFVQQFKAEQDRLDVLINNGGVMRTPNSKTADGFEMQLGVNHLGHFYLTHLLLDVLKKSAPSRIINVSSLAHKRGKIKKDDLNSDKSYDAADAYAQSKLANVLFTRELAKRLSGTGVTVNALHPGIVDTEIIRHMGFFNSWTAALIVKPFVWPFVKSPRQGAHTSVYLALSPSVANVTGKYFSNCEEAEVSEAAKDDVVAAWLWAASEKWTRLHTTTT